MDLSYIGELELEEEDLPDDIKELWLIEGQDPDQFVRTVEQLYYIATNQDWSGYRDHRRGSFRGRFYNIGS